MLASLRPFGWRAVLDALFPPDPGALRLLAALRATLAGVLTFFVVMLLGTVIALPIADRIIGFDIALFTTATVRDGTPRQQLITIALAPAAAFLATVLAALLIDQPLAAAIVVPPLMFATAYCTARIPRYAALGMVALIAYIVGLVIRQPPDTLPIRLVVMMLAAGAAALVRLVLLPARPQAELDHLRGAIHAGIGRVLDQIAAAVAAGTWTEPARAELNREVYRLGDVVMLAQARVAALAALLPDQTNLGNRWLHLLAIELGVERIARVALQDLGTPADRAELLAVLAALRHGADPPPQKSTGPLASGLALLGHVLGEAPRAASSSVAAPPPPSAGPALRPALQTAIAAALAIMAGNLVSPNRWYWAAFAAFVMFQGTRCRSESIAKGVQFMVGTLAGVVVGMLLATLLSGHEILTMTAIVAAVFLAFQANVAAYGMMVFWITIILGLMFGMLGYFAPELLLLRLRETAVGAICGLLVASLILVRRERAATQDATIAFLQALGPLVGSSARVLLGGAPEPDLAARILACEQRSRELHAIAQSEQFGHAVSYDEALRRRVLMLEACEQWARELGEICLQSASPGDPDLAGLVRETAAHIDAALAGLLDRLSNQSGAVAVAGEAIDELGEASQDELANRPVRLLLRVDAALVHMALR